MSYSEALEVQIKTLRFCRSEAGDMLFRNLNKISRTEAGRGHEGHRDLSRIVLDSLENADSYYWDGAFCDLMAQVSLSMPPWTLTEESVPSPCGYLYFSRPLPFAIKDEQVGGLGALSWSAVTVEGQRMLNVIGYYAHNAFAFPLPMALLGWPLGHDTVQVVERVRRASSMESNTDGWTMQVARYFASCLAFIDQRILVGSHRTAERHARKRVAAEGWTHEPLIRVVELRRRTSESKPGDDPKTVAWSHQWVVSGHWHQYWTGPADHKVLQPRWIMPYVKGPDDKPLKPPRAKVFAVVR